MSWFRRVCYTFGECESTLLYSSMKFEKQAGRRFVLCHKSLQKGGGSLEMSLSGRQLSAHPSVFCQLIRFCSRKLFLTESVSCKRACNIKYHKSAGTTSKASCLRGLYPWLAPIGLWFVSFISFYFYFIQQKHFVKLKTLHFTSVASTFLEKTFRAKFSIVPNCSITFVCLPVAAPFSCWQGLI